MKVGLRKKQIFDAHLNFNCSMELWIQVDTLAKVLRHKSKSSILRDLVEAGARATFDEMDDDQKKQFDIILEAGNISRELIRQNLQGE